MYIGKYNGYQDMQLSQEYPAGSFEAIEALTFISEASWQAVLAHEFCEGYFSHLWGIITKGYIRQAVLGHRIAPCSRMQLFTAFNLTPLHKVCHACGLHTIVHRHAAI